MSADALDHGAALASAGRFAEAVPHFRAAITADPGSDVAVVGWRNLGHVLAEAGRLHESAAAFESAVAVLRSLATAGDGDAELEEDYAALRAECSHVHMGIAHEAHEAKHGPEAIAKALRAAWRMTPADATLRRGYSESLQQLGVQHDRAGRADEAVAVTRAALSFAPDATSAYLNLGVLVLRQARQARQRRLPAPAPPLNGATAMTSEALASFATAIRLEPTYGDAYYNLANELRAQGRANEALVAYARGVVAAPGHTGLRSTLGYALLASGDAANARRGVRALRAAGGPWESLQPWQHPAAVTLSLPPSRPVHAMSRGDLSGAIRGEARGDQQLDDPKWKCVLETLEAAAPALAQEASGGMRRGAFHIQHEGIAEPNRGWRELELLKPCRERGAASEGGGAPVLDTACATLAALSSSGLEVRGAAFSALLPGTRLLPHSGTTNSRLTIHLGLSVPTPGAARLRIGQPTAAAMAAAAAAAAGEEGGQQQQQVAVAVDEAASVVEVAWAAGEAFVWDDSFAHEVRWAGDSGDDAAALASGDDAVAFAAGQPRVILLVSVTHPSLRPDAPVCGGGPEAS